MDTNSRIAFAAGFLKHAPDFPNTADAVKILMTKVIQGPMFIPSCVELTHEDRASAFQATHTGIELSCILPTKLDTLRSHSRKFKIRPKTKIPGATQLRFNFWDAANFLIVSKLIEQGVNTKVIRQFLSDYRQHSFDRAIDGTFLLVVPARQPARVVFFDKAQTVAARDALLKCGVQCAEISLVLICRELIEKIHCHHNKIDYQELAEAQLRKQLADWEEAFGALPERTIHAEIIVKREK
jgi:hypothetical protein